MYKQKNHQNLMIILKNFLTMCTVLLLVIVLVFVIQGWVINSKGETVQTGLVQFASNISGATVEIGKKTLNEKTTTKSQVIPGEYEFKIWREGYETWYRKTSVRGGRILWLNYARLIPKEKKVQSFFNIENVKAVKYSVDNKKALIIGEDSVGIAKFWIVEFGESPKISEISLPEKLFDRNLADGEKYLQGIAGYLTIENLSENATRAILRWKKDDSQKWILADFNDSSKSVNLNDNFGLNFSKIRPLNRDYSKFYVLSEKALRELDFDRMTISANLLNDIVDFENYNDSVLSFIKQDKEGIFSVGIFEKGNQSVILSKDNSSLPKIAISRYYNENYVHVLANKKLQIYKGSDWVGANKPKLIKKVEFDFEPTGINLNQEGRIVSVSSNDKTATYDIETNSKYDIASGDLSWLDNFILYNFKNDKITLRDFDGYNVHSVLECSHDFGAILSRDEKFIYGFRQKKDGKFELVRLKMIL